MKNLNNSKMVAFLISFFIPFFGMWAILLQGRHSYQFPISVHEVNQIKNIAYFGSVISCISIIVIFYIIKS